MDCAEACGVYGEFDEGISREGVQYRLEDDVAAASEVAACRYCEWTLPGPFSPKIVY